MSRMRKIPRSTIVAALVLAVAMGSIGLFRWKRGTPYQEPFWSPNRQYYVQKYSNWVPVVVQGNRRGSDAIDGYIRLYDSKGTLIAERFETFVRDVEPLWVGDKVYLKGVAAMDADPWLLPGPAD
jgi:hypothetical protein